MAVVERGVHILVLIASLVLEATSTPINTYRGLVCHHRSKVYKLNIEVHEVVALLAAAIVESVDEVKRCIALEWEGEGYALAIITSYNTIANEVVLGSNNLNILKTVLYVESEVKVYMCWIKELYKLVALLLRSILCVLFECSVNNLTTNG